MNGSLLSGSLRGLATSSIDGKIQLIASQIGSIDVGARVSAKTRDLDKLDEKSKKVEARLKECEELHQKRTALLKDSLAKFSKVFEEEKLGSETIFGEQMKRITRLEDKMTDLLTTMEKVHSNYQAKSRKRPECAKVPC
jgi:uncharacterized protein (DUF342 family)